MAIITKRIELPASALALIAKGKTVNVGKLKDGQRLLEVGRGNFDPLKNTWSCEYKYDDGNA